VNRIGARTITRKIGVWMKECAAEMIK